jgi:membrane-associated phospholipid phosphatase
MPTPVDALGADVLDALTGPNLLLFGGAVAATDVMAFGGADHAIRVSVQQRLVAPAYADGSLYAGYIVPALVAPGVYLTGLAIGDATAAGAGSAAVQALAVTVIATAILKVGVGRGYPLAGGDPRAPDRLDHPEYARQFRPFQTLWPLPAWPSGHATGTVSVAAALSAYYPDQLWIPCLGYPVALAIGFGLVDGDRHWASDVVAGALIGHAIGYATGRAFRRRLLGLAGGRAEPTLVPVLGTGTVGLAVSGPW